MMRVGVFGIVIPSWSNHSVRLENILTFKIPLFVLSEFLEENSDIETKTPEDVSDKQKHQLKHRELFLSRQVETLPATHIRGKCVVTLLNETESLLSYLNKEVRSF